MVVEVAVGTEDEATIVTEDGVTTGAELWVSSSLSYTVNRFYLGLAYEKRLPSRHRLGIPHFFVLLAFSCKNGSALPTW